MKTGNHNSGSWRFGQDKKENLFQGRSSVSAAHSQPCDLDEKLILFPAQDASASWFS
jgi:hypothetical protein